MNNKKVIILLGVIALVVSVSIVASVISSKSNDKSVEVNVVEDAYESNKDENEGVTPTDVPEEDPDVTETPKDEDEEVEVTPEPTKEANKDEGDADIEDTGNGVIKSTFVHVGHTDNSDTYLGVTGGGESMKQYFYDFDQFDYFLTLLGMEVPEHDMINHQDNVFTAYYADGMYLTYNVKSDKMIVTTGVKSDE